MQRLFNLCPRVVSDVPGHLDEEFDLGCLLELELGGQLLLSAGLECEPSGRAQRRHGQGHLSEVGHGNFFFAVAAIAFEHHWRLPHRIGGRWGVGEAYRRPTVAPWCHRCYIVPNQAVVLARRGRAGALPDNSSAGGGSSAMRRHFLAR